MFHKYLVDTGCLAHQEPPCLVLLGACLKDIDSFEGHLLQSWLVDGRGIVTSGRGRETLEGVRIHLAIEPIMEVSLASATQQSIERMICTI